MFHEPNDNHALRRDVRADDPADSRLENRLGTILRIGVRVSTLFLGAGLILTLAVPESTLSGTLMTIGLVLLMATPIARVAASVIEYAVERDWQFCLLTSLVLLELGAGIVAALVFHGRL
jgi:uncharacterized membrane protein